MRILTARWPGLALAKSGPSVKHLNTSQSLSDQKYAAMNSIDERDLESGTNTTMWY